jgi:TolB-like protein/AraC-like DNA-binding protein
MSEKADHRLIKELQEAVDANLTNEQFGVEMLAEMVNMSRSGLHRRLKGINGQSVSQFIREYRLARAKELLNDPSLSISEVAYRVGFNSPTYFSKSFSDFYGYPPGESKLKSTLEITAEAHIPEEKINIKKSYLHRLQLPILVLSLAAMFWFGVKVAQNSPTYDARVKTIAVLPFKNQSADESNQYFADGIQDAILNKLAQVKSIKVVSRTSVEKYRNSKLTIPEIAKELGVSYLLEGSAQKYNDEIKVITQLIDGANDRNIWSEDYTRDFEDVFSLQSDIATSITSKLVVSLSASEIKEIQKRSATNVAAYDYFLKGDYLRNRWNKESLEKSIPQFEQAIMLDSQYTDAYVGLAYAYIVMGSIVGVIPEEVAQRKALEILNKALHIDPDHYEANNVLGATYSFYFWNFKKALHHFRRTKEISGHYGNYSLDFFTKMDLEDEAREAIDYYRDNEPLNDDYISFEAQLEGLNGNVSGAIEILDQEFPLFEGHLFMRECAKLYYTYGAYEKSAKALEKMKNSTEVRSPLVVWLEACLAFHAGEAHAAQLLELESMFEQKSSGSPAWFLALYYFEVGNRDLGFYWLEESFARHEVEMTWLKMEPVLKNYRLDSRYKVYYEKMGFIDARI